MKNRIVLVVLLSISLLLITGCGRKKYVEETDSFTITDNKRQELTFTYPKKMSFQTKELEGVDESSEAAFHYFEVYNADYYFYMNISLEPVGKSYYDTIKRQNSTAQGYKEYKWNNYEGFAYTVTEDVYFYAILSEEENDMCTMLKGVGYSKNPYETVTEVFNEDNLQDVFNTMTFKKAE